MFVAAKLSPVIVTDISPDCTMFTLLMYEASGASNEKTSELVPMWLEIVTATSLVILADIFPEQLTVLAEDQDVVAHVLAVLSMLAVGEGE
jgi:hypothetical protein